MMELSKPGASHSDATGNLLPLDETHRDVQNSSFGCPGNENGLGLPEYSSVMKDLKSEA